MFNDHGRRVLIVEDEALVAFDIEEMLVDLGHEVAGLATRIDRALALASNEAFDLAILDINVAGKQSFPVADLLRCRRIPFIFSTGYGRGGLSDEYRDAPALQKPFGVPELERAISKALSP